MKLHIFKDNNLIKSVNHPWQALRGSSDLDEFNYLYPKIIPIDAYVFLETRKEWYVKRTGKRLRPVPDPLVPKELKVILLVLGVPL